MRKQVAELKESEVARRQAEGALSESEKKFSALLESASEAIVVVDGNGRILLINAKAEKMFGYSRDELIGQAVEVLLPERFRGAHVGHRAGYLSEPRARPMGLGLDLAGRRKDGTEFPVEISLSFVETEGGLLVMSLITDITRRKQAEEQARLHQQGLIQVDKMSTLGILVSGVAHEINNPNNYILLNAKIFSKVWNDVMPILREYYEKNGDFVLAGMPYTKAHEKIGQLISGISEGAIRIQKIVQGLKDFARQDKDDLDQSVDINSVIESAIVIVNNLISKSTNRFSVQYGKNLPKIRGNFQQLEQVVINLITNSCQALQSMDKSLALSTSYDSDSGSVVVKVCDEGEGISPDNLKRIFDPFFTTKRDSGGTGLGLSVSYNIVKNHGGDLIFTSELKKGTTATLILPVNRNSSSPSEVKG